VKRFLLALIVTASALAGASVAEAAAPRIIIISGPPLGHQVVISDWPRIAMIVSSSPVPSPIPRRQLADRPRLRVSMFWGPQWNEYVSSGRRVSALRPRQADQFGWLYPAWRGRPAVIDLPWAGPWPRAVSTEALTILRRYGVPIRLRR
jgi:hypothetical protein